MPLTLLQKRLIWWLFPSPLGNITWLRILCTLSFTRCGIEFDWHGDPVYWCWPWRRDQYTSLAPWVSLGFEGCFKSLKAIDKEWNDYFKACNK